MGKNTNMVIEGIVVPYNRLSLPLATRNGMPIFEMVLPGAFTDSIAAIKRKAYGIKVNVEHDEGAMMQIGSEANVALEERPEGLWMRMAFIDDSISDDLFKKIEAGFVRGLSMESSPLTPADIPQYQQIEGRGYIRKLPRLRLHGFAITNKPAYPDATITNAGATFVRSISETEIAQIEKELNGYVPIELLECEAELLGVHLPWRR